MIPIIVCSYLTTPKFEGIVSAMCSYKRASPTDTVTLLQHDTIEGLLKRGEKLDDLVGRSEDLSMQSKAFYKTVGISASQ